MGFVDSVSSKSQKVRFGDVLSAVEEKRADQCNKSDVRDGGNLVFAEADYVKDRILQQLGFGDDSLDYHGGTSKYQMEVSKQLAANKGGQPQDHVAQARQIVRQTDKVIEGMVPSVQVAG